MRRQSEKIDQMINNLEFIEKYKQENEEVEKIRKVLDDPNSTKLDKISV